MDNGKSVVDAINKKKEESKERRLARKADSRAAKSEKAVEAERQRNHRMNKSSARLSHDANHKLQRATSGCNN